MSRHIGRKQRWSQLDARRYTSALGQVFYEQNGWYADLDYKTLAPSQTDSSPPTWVSHHQRLGPYKRPRNAMIAAEDRAVLLKRRHGEHVVLESPLLP